MADEKAPFGPESDPGDYKVDEINDYLASASDEEVERVLDLESKGKARSSVKASEPAQAAVTEYRVTAALVQLKSERGDKVFYLSKDDVVPGHASKASIEHLESLGFVEKV